MLPLYFIVHHQAHSLSKELTNLYYKTVRILCVCADEIEKTTGTIFKILFATDRFALGHYQKNTEFFP